MHYVEGEQRKDRTSHVCYFVIATKDDKSRCGISFPNARQLKLHKTQSGHILQKRKAKLTMQNPPKQLKLSECFIAKNNHQDTAVDDSDDNEDDEDCVACDICKFINRNQ